jgi:ADP-ribosyl-[dinitrogen reductase] hydrolase
MRLAPVAIAYWELLESDAHLLASRLRESSLPTHGSDACQDACVYMGLVLSGLIAGRDRDVVLDPSWATVRALREGWHPRIAEVVAGSFREGEPPEIKGSGWVVQSLEAALWAFHDSNDFEEAVLRAVNLGDDTDTTGAVCGQFAGAFFGESGIPDHLREGLARPEMIEEALSRLGVS